MEIFQTVFIIVFFALLIVLAVIYYERNEAKKSSAGDSVRKATSGGSRTGGARHSDTKSVSLYRLQEICETRRLADNAGSYDEFCSAISGMLLGHPELKDMYYVTDSAHSLHRIEEEGVAWTFLLMNPSHPLIERFDKKIKKTVKAAQTLDPKDCLIYDSYDPKKVEEKLGCSSSIGRYITDYWSILPLEYNPVNRTINLDYVLFKLYETADSAAELYDAYFACGIEAARDKVQEFLASKNSTLRAMFPSGVMDCTNREEVLRLDFYQENREQLWKEMPHPFFKHNSRDPQRSAELFLKYLMQQGQFRYALSRAFLFTDGHIEYIGFNSKGFESESELRFKYSEQYSYHDGGGGYSEVLEFRVLSEDEQKNLSIPEEPQTDGYRVPPCRGYWKEDNTEYYVEPFEMDGVFTLISDFDSWELED